MRISKQERVLVVSALCLLVVLLSLIHIFLVAQQIKAGRVEQGESFIIVALIKISRDVYKRQALQ